MKGVITNNKAAKLVKYPTLCKSIVDGSIYTMDSSTSGTKLTTGHKDDGCVVGIHYTDLPMLAFKIFHGTIELTEE